MLATNKETKLRENTSEKRRMRSLLQPIHLESNKYILIQQISHFEIDMEQKEKTEKEVLGSHEASNTPQSYFFTSPRRCAILEMNHTDATY